MKNKERFSAIESALNSAIKSDRQLGWIKECNAALIALDELRQEQRTLYLCNKCGYSGYAAEHPGCGYNAYVIKRASDAATLAAVGNYSEIPNSSQPDPRDLRIKALEDALQSCLDIMRQFDDQMAGYPSFHTAIADGCFALAAPKAEYGFPLAPVGDPAHIAAPKRCMCPVENGFDKPDCGNCLICGGVIGDPTTNRLATTVQRASERVAGWPEWKRGIQVAQPKPEPCKRCDGTKSILTSDGLSPNCWTEPCPDCTKGGK